MTTNTYTFTMNFLYLILAIAYALFPYDLVPDLLPGWGWLDDILVIFFLWRFFPGFKKLRPSSESRSQDHRRSTWSDATDRDSGSSACGDEPRDPYLILGLQPGASQDEIRKAYRTLAHKYHPDRVDHLGEEFIRLAEERFKEIKQAYETLKKTERNEHRTSNVQH